MESNHNKEPKKPTRRENRLAAVQFLYMWEMNPNDTIDEALVDFFAMPPQKKKSEYAFTEELVRGAIEHLDAVDEKIREYSQNWKFSRIAKSDLAILRLAIYELLNRKDIPPVVSINEAIELAKSFSNDDSKRFINGILDKVKGTLDRPLRSSESK